MRVLENLCSTPSPAGLESGIIGRISDMIGRDYYNQTVDNLGNLLVTQKEGEGKKILISAHVDELGLIISSITDDGFLHFLRNSGEDRKCIPGQRFRILTRDGKHIPAVCMKKAIHLESDEEYDSVQKIESLVLSVGAEDKKEVEDLGISVGDLVVYERNFTTLGSQKICSQGLDDKAGVWVVLESLWGYTIRKSQEVSFGFCCQEETGLVGADTLMLSYQPDISIDLDVCHSTESSLGIDTGQFCDVKLGKGVVIEFSSCCSRELSNHLVDLAKKKGIPYQIKAGGAGGGTNTKMFQRRGGAKTCLLSIPCQNMHTPIEIVDKRDLKSARDLILAFLGE